MVDIKTERKNDKPFQNDGSFLPLLALLYLQHLKWYIISNSQDVANHICVNMIDDITSVCLACLTLYVLLDLPDLIRSIV